MADGVVTLTGTPEVMAKVARALQSARGQAADGLYEVAEEMMTESKQRVPVDTGALKNSGHVEKPQDTGENISVALGYGGPSAEYALTVHEDLDALHKVGEAKYLESVVREYAPYVLERVAKAIRF